MSEVPLHVYHDHARRRTTFQSSERQIRLSRISPSAAPPGCLNEIRKQAWILCRTSAGVRLCWELEEPKGPKGPVVP
jgi:hypothetical protein